VRKTLGSALCFTWIIFSKRSWR